MKPWSYIILSLLAIMARSVIADSPSPATLSLEQLQALVQTKGCASCHGTRGQGNLAMKGPKLAGQPADMLASKLRNYRSGALKNPVMNVMAYRLSDQEIAELSEYFSRFQPEP